MGSGAKIFLVSLLISLCAFGLVSFIIVSAVKDGAAPTYYNVSGENTALDSSIKGESFDLLTIFTEEDGSLLSAVLLRYDRERSEISFTPICPKTTLNDTDLESMYLSGGVSGFMKGVYYLTGIQTQYYTLATASGIAEAIDLVGNVRFTFDERVNVGAFSFEEGSTSLSGEMALALIRYGNAQTHREEYAAQVMRSICERLSLNDGEEAYAKICARVSTSFTKSDFAERNGLISSYGQMKKSTVELCGTYRGDGEAHYFVSDVEATLDLFSKYRKIYN